MEHFYQDIHGYFNFEEAYKEYADRLPREGIFVELGSFLGKSISYLAVELLNQNKDCEIYCVDTWTGMEKSVGEDAIVNEYYESCKYPFWEFMNNIWNVRKNIWPIIGDTKEKHELFDDEEIDILFLDADHSQIGVLTDLSRWVPKVKPGGIIAGHDYWKQNDVALAVNRFFPDKEIRTFCHNVWEVQK